MFRLALKWLLNAVAFILTTKVVALIFDPLVFRVEDFGSALAAALVLGLVNAFIRPIVKIFTLPINIMTLGLFTFIINGLMLKIVAGVVPGVHVVGFLPAVVGAAVLSVISGILTAIL